MEEGVLLVSEVDCAGCGSGPVNGGGDSLDTVGGMLRETKKQAGRPEEATRKCVHLCCLPGSGKTNVKTQTFVCQVFPELSHMFNRMWLHTWHSDLPEHHYCLAALSAPALPSPTTGQACQPHPGALSTPDTPATLSVVHSPYTTLANFSVKLGLITQLGMAKPLRTSSLFTQHMSFSGCCQVSAYVSVVSTCRGEADLYEHLWSLLGLVT